MGDRLADLGVTMNDDIRVIGVDVESIRGGEAFGRLCVPFVLSAAPPRAWKAAFDHVYNGLLFEGKRQVRLVQDHLEVLLFGSDDLQHQLDVLERAVDETNAELRQRVREDHGRAEQWERRRERETQDISRLRTEAEHLRFETPSQDATPTD